MSFKTRRILIVLAVVLLLLAVAALTYALLPTPIRLDTIPVTPTFFIPPGGAP